MSDEKNSDEITVKIISEDEIDKNAETIEDNVESIFVQELKNLNLCAYINVHPTFFPLLPEI